MRARAPLVVLLGLVLILLPFHTVIDVGRGEDEYRTLGTAADIPMALLAVALLVAMAVGVRSRALWPLASGAAVAVLLVISLVIHPSGDGLVLVLRFIAALAIAASLTLVSREERVLLTAVLVGTTLVQIVVAAGQVATGAPLGLTGLGELQDPIPTVSDSPAPRGTMSHHFVLAALGLIASGAAAMIYLRARAASAWLVATALSVMPVGTSYSRTAIIGVGAGAAAVLVGSGRSARAIATVVALAVGVAIPVAIEHNGWFAMARSSVAHAPDRGTLLGQAAQVIAQQPLIGYGPGRYYVGLNELEARSPGAVEVDQVPHSVPVIIAADAGVPAGVLFVVLLVWLGWYAFRAGPPTLALYLLLLPFWLNDHFGYTYAQGVALLGCWMGLIAGSREAEA